MNFANSSDNCIIQMRDHKLENHEEIEYLYIHNFQLKNRPFIYNVVLYDIIYLRKQGRPFFTGKKYRFSPINIQM